MIDRGKGEKGRRGIIFSKRRIWKEEKRVRKNRLKRKERSNNGRRRTRIKRKKEEGRDLDKLMTLRSS
jgi:hypothetical protein